MKFCPKCGAPKTGRFCGGCGFAFDAVLIPEARVVAPVGEWRPDPINPAQQRFWDGLAWTNEVRLAPATPAGAPIAIVVSPDNATATSTPAAPVVETNLVYGEGYDASKNCPNCGEPHKPKATTCSLCDETL